MYPKLVECEGACVTDLAQGRGRGSNFLRSLAHTLGSPSVWWWWRRPWLDKAAGSQEMQQQSQGALHSAGVEVLHWNGRLARSLPCTGTYIGEDASPGRPPHVLGRFPVSYSSGGNY